MRPTFRIVKWCGREDSNFHGLSATATSTLRVYQFRHDRTSCDERAGRGAAATGKARPLAKAPGPRNAARAALERPTAGLELKALFTKCRRARYVVVMLLLTAAAVALSPPNLTIHSSAATAQARATVRI